MWPAAKPCPTTRAPRLPNDSGPNSFLRGARQHCRTRPRRKSRLLQSMLFHGYCLSHIEFRLPTLGELQGRTSSRTFFDEGAYQRPCTSGTERTPALADFHPVATTTAALQQSTNPLIARVSNAAGQYAMQAGPHCLFPGPCPAPLRSPFSTCDARCLNDVLQCNTNRTLWAAAE